MQPTSQYTETSWLRQGLIFGLLLGLVLLITWLATLTIPFFLFRSGVSVFFPLILSFVAGLLVGLRVSRQTGRMSAGLLAGLITGVCAGLLFLIVSYLYIAVRWYSAGHIDSPLSFFQSSSSLFMLGQRLLPALIGAIIGGAIGRAERNYRV